MIKKIINSYDIHIDGQQLRVVNRHELNGVVEGFNNIDLLLNEPRGSKYVNLIIYEEADGVLDVEIYSNSTLDNKDILFKNFIRSLLDRGNINQQHEYTVRDEEDKYIYNHDDLTVEHIFGVENTESPYMVNDELILVEAVGFELTIENITEIKRYAESYRDYNGYLVLMNDDMHVTINANKMIVAYPVTEVVSVLNQIFDQQIVKTLNSSKVNINEGQYFLQYHLISNSQFYIDDSDIYRTGFVIK